MEKFCPLIRGGTEMKSNNGYKGKRSKGYAREILCRYCKKDNHDTTKRYKLENVEKGTYKYIENGKPNDEGNASVVASK
jgi:hypothetical protein